MGNLCCRRVGYSPNGVQTEQGRNKDQQQPDIPQHQQKIVSNPMSKAYHSSGDDCAINELLEGRMDLDVILPNNRKVRLTVERRTPMMDLLVQAASATKINPAGHTIHVFGDNKDSGTLPYKPSTPIGSLDANTICIIAKKDAQGSTIKRCTKMTNRPFESTFRVQVHLPRNQLTVARLSPCVRISELRNMVCQEKGLNINRYQLVRPSDPGQPLNGDMTLAEYGTTEVTLLSNSCIESHICNSTSHIMPYSKRVEEQKKKTGILRLIAEDATQNSQKHNEFLRPPLPSTKASETQHQGRYKPKKRRPAPPPPPPLLPIEQQPPPFHSRQSSSDSSGYHEATSSYLHDEQCAPLEPAKKASSDSSGVSSLDAKPPLANVAKKRKAPPPPPAGKDSEVERAGDDKYEVLTDVPSKVEILPVTPKSPADVEKVELCKVSPRELTAVKTRNEGDAVTRVALVALNARIEQDVTQREIASNIQAAFHSLDCTQKSVPSLLAIKQRNDYNDRKTEFKNFQVHHQINGVTGYSENSKWNEQFICKDDKNRASHQDKTGLSCNADSLEQNKKSFQNHQCNVAVKNRSKVEVNREDKISPKFREKEGLDNFELINGYLPKRNSTTKDISSHYSELREEECLNSISISKRAQLLLKNEHSDSSLPHSICGFSKINDRVTNEKTSIEVIQSKASLTNSFNSLSGVNSCDQNGDLGCGDKLCYPLQKSSASYNLELKDDTCGDTNLEVFPPPPSQFRGVETPLKDHESTLRNHQQVTINLKRSSSLLNLRNTPICKEQIKCQKKSLQRSLSDLSAEDKDEFGAEQERLQKEYIKLQRQFILWQQQLLNNHAMLREECIVPSQYARTFRQSHSLPEGEDYSDGDQIPCPLVTRSLSYEPTNKKCSTLPRSSINIPPLEFGPVSLTKGSSTLRSSKTKSYFKPPQVRVSTKNRQRLPPEIRKDGNLDIYDDAKILSTILPSLKLISESSDSINGDDSRLKSGFPENIRLENLRNNDSKKVPPIVPNKTISVTASKIAGESITNWRPNCDRNGNEHVNIDKIVNRLLNGDGIVNARSNGETDGHLKCANEYWPKRLNGQINCAVPPPPPVPLKKTSGTLQESKFNKGLSKNEVKQQVDPREELMQEIRRFGGRTALRKISLDMCS